MPYRASNIVWLQRITRSKLLRITRSKLPLFFLLWIPCACVTPNGTSTLSSHTLPRRSMGARSISFRHPGQVTRFILGFDKSCNASRNPENLSLLDSGSHLANKKMARFVRNDGFLSVVGQASITISSRRRRVITGKIN